MKNERRPDSREAVFSADRHYRYRLTIRWNPSPMCVFLMLNPSTADEVKDDPTIRRCVGYAKRWGHGGVAVVNLFAWRSTDPSVLCATVDPVGPENSSHILQAAQLGDPVICAWGKLDKKLRDRAGIVIDLLAHRPLYRLKANADGSPAHPLYLRGDLQPERLDVLPAVKESA
jgi:hypothetical protein